MSPETLRTCAAIFEMERVDVDRFGRKPVKPTEIELVAAHALRFMAAAIESGIVAVDPGVEHQALPCTTAQLQPCTEGATTRTSSSSSSG